MAHHCGSLPRVWGQRWPSRENPAYVAVHPHGCGDNYYSIHVSTLADGSPPRVWGQLSAQSKAPSSTSVHPHGCGDNGDGRLPGHALDRFTPTGVGTTQCTRVLVALDAVHPHGCGDNYRSSFPPLSLAGSPPRVWGQPGRLGYRVAGRRFTPTGVGTTFATSSACSRPAVHPHGCGDNAFGE